MPQGESSLYDPQWRYASS